MNGSKHGKSKLSFQGPTMGSALLLTKIMVTLVDDCQYHYCIDLTLSYSKTLNLFY